MKEKNGKLYPGWIRLTYKDDGGYKRRYYDKYDTEKSILINCWYSNYK